MVPLASGQAALTALDAGYLFVLSVKLLDFPADAALLLGSLRIILSHIIGDDIVRSGGGNQDPEQFKVGVQRHFEELYRLALPDIGI